MSIRKRNEYLEGESSDEEAGNGYNLDEDEVGRGGIRGHQPKRRKTDADSDQESFGPVEEDPFHEYQDVTTDYAYAHAEQKAEPDSRFGAFEEDEEDADALSAEDAIAPLTTPALRASAPKQVTAAQKAARKSGVVYISRVPPFMKPQTLKHFLSPHAPKGIGRIFLTPEDHAAHLRRVKNGGNKKKSFTDGWVEFASKKEAKAAADMLNGNIIGGKKGNFYHDDLWNMKYLKGFKWSNLTEQIAAENAEREARMREEIRKTRKENKAFLEDVERGKMLEGMETKKKAKLEKGDGGEISGGGDRKSGREFKQRKVQSKKAAGSEPDASGQASRVLSTIFG